MFKSHFMFFSLFAIYFFSQEEFTGCLIREFRIQSVVGKDPVELEKIALPEEDISTLFYSIRCRSIKKKYKNLRFFYSKVKLFFKIVLRYYFPQSSRP
jgi:hypothetical protein